MLVAAIDTPWRVALLFAAGIAAGISNGVAGGGTFITFPTLLALGIAPLQANVSSTVGLVPSVLAGVRVFRRELSAHTTTLKRLVPTCVAGSAVGTFLLLTESPATFAAVVPWLIGVATALFYVVYRYLEDYFLSPRVMRRTVRVSAGLTIVATLIGAALLGLIGALVAVPAAATLQLLLEEVVMPRQNQR